MDRFSPKKLAEQLVEKHDRFISEYSDELEKVQQITMLNEKKDQLMHWVEEKGSQSKYRKELDDTEGELNQLQVSFKPKAQSYYAGVKERVAEHQEARNYWMAKIGEFKS